ncbi:MAG: hypothetical protein RLZZ453_258 [Chlamydiota bacterium]|jgi:TolA-binding protein
MTPTTKASKLTRWSDEPFPLETSSKQHPFPIPLPRRVQNQVRELQERVDEMTKTVALLQEQVTYLTQDLQHLRMEMTRQTPIEDRVEAIEDFIKHAIIAATSGPPPSYEETVDLSLV